MLETPYITTVHCEWGCQCGGLRVLLGFERGDLGVSTVGSATVVEEVDDGGGMVALVVACV